MSIRITGMNSGLDVDKIISDLMKAERMPQDKLKQKKDLLSFQTDLYREINTKLASVREAVSILRFGSNLNGTKATSSSTAVTVSSTNNAPVVNHTIEVIELAKGATKGSTSSVSVEGLTANAAVNGTTTISSTNNNFSITLDGTVRNITIADGSYSPAQLQQELQSKIDVAFGANKITVNKDGLDVLSIDPIGSAGYKPQVILNEGNGALAELKFNDDQSYKLDINATISNSSGKFTTALQDPGAGTHDFIINGQTISYTGTDTVQGIMNKVNASAAGVVMSYDSITDKFSFISKTTGSTAQVKLENGSAGNLISAIKMDTTVVTGTDAEVKIDGVTSMRSSNSFSLDGVTYTLNDKTTAPVTVGITNDVDGTVDKIKKFVDSYNELIDLVNRRLSEKKSQDFLPLTEEQRSEMSEADITLWEGKVKNGLLQNDPTLKNIKNTIRSVFIKSVPGVAEAFNSLYDVGITTVKHITGNTSEAGKLQIDETKLRAALSQDPDAVKAMFTNSSTVESEKGVFVDLYEKANTLIDNVIKRAGRVGGAVNDVTTDLGGRITKLDTQISRMSDTLTRKENFYYKRFAEMEKAISMNNSQLAFLQQQMA